MDWQAAFRNRPPRTELDFRRKEEDLEYLVNLPLGLQGRQLVIPEGLVQGEKLTETLRQLDARRSAHITDFLISCQRAFARWRPIWRPAAARHPRRR